ncbi:MAG: diaminopimelate decarboxylase [Rhodobiaceae bacterium]|nr:diaminopimelate decarboxylase [Rhodobiaceae bacterium]OUT74672.1 MAG: diaminopimelate decarboxylase [Rhizobiales bacterium TMED25]
MNPIEYKNNQLHIEKINIQELSNSNQTPFYCYSEESIINQYDGLYSAFDMDIKIFYAMKANSNLSIIKLLLNKGSGIDVVSGGEIERAISAGAKGKDIIYSGIGKTDEELNYAIESKVHCINVESQSELIRINDISKSLGVKQNIAIRINPDVDAKTHIKITTGMAENKFGIEYDYTESIYKIAADLKNINIAGISVHIGSQITSLKPFKKAYTIMYDIIKNLRSIGHKIDHVDLGGGLGVSYTTEENIPTFKEYANLIQSIFGNADIKVYIEPGRLLVANSGLLITKVTDVKTTTQKTFIIVDAAMNDFIRPTLYGSYHEILPIKNNLGTSNKVYDIVGPICETGDYFAKNRKMNSVKIGSIIAIKSVGAYGSVQSSNYNSRPQIAEILVKDDKYEIIRERVEVKDLIKQEKIATWL